MFANNMCIFTMPFKNTMKRIVAKKIVYSNYLLCEKKCNIHLNAHDLCLTNHHCNPPSINELNCTQAKANSICQLTFIQQIHSTTKVQDVFEINSEEDFIKRVMQTSLPVIVNFHADWCEPCGYLKPLLRKIADDYVGRLHLAEVMVDDHVDLLHHFEVTAVPAVLGVHRGVVTEKFIGLVTDQQIKDFVKKLLEKNPLVST